MSVLSEFRRLPGVIDELGGSILAVAKLLQALIELQAQKGSSDERLEELERSRAHWEAQMEAIMLKADSTLKSASNAESRSRTMMKHAEKLADPFDIEGEEEPEGITPRDAPGGEAEGVQPVPLGLEEPQGLTFKQIALRAKYA